MGKGIECSGIGIRYRFRHDIAKKRNVQKSQRRQHRPCADCCADRGAESRLELNEAKSSADEFVRESEDADNYSWHSADLSSPSTDDEVFRLSMQSTAISDAPQILHPLASFLLDYCKRAV